MNPGDRAVKWLSNLTLCDDFAGQPFVLRPWQAAIVRTLFGTLRPDGLRQYRQCLLMLPRKQAKTQLAAGIATYFLLGTGKEGQQAVCAASDRDQAANLFDKVASMIEADRYLARQVKIYYSTRRIETRRGGNSLRVLSSDGRRQHGLNPSLILFDEVHTQPNRDLYDALTSACATRSEPLTLLISTAGNDRQSLCYDLFEYARKVRDGRHHDPKFLPILYGADDADDWTAEATWHKAMPALGDFASLDFIRGEFVKATESASEESKFRQLYLNQWVAKASKWLNRERWERCAKFLVDPFKLKGRKCYGGLDLSNTADVTALVLVFAMDDGTYQVLCRFWIPRAYAEKRDKKDGTHYLDWARQGFITLTDGDVIDHDFVIAEAVALAEVYEIREIRADPFVAIQPCQEMIREGINVVFMRQNFTTMSDPIKALEVGLARDKVHHGDNPVLNWMADNVVIVTDGVGNVRFDKKKSAEKIDGMPCLAMAYSAAIAAEGDDDDGESGLVRI